MSDVSKYLLPWTTSHVQYSNATMYQRGRLITATSFIGKAKQSVNDWFNLSIHGISTGNPLVPKWSVRDTEYDTLLEAMEAMDKLLLDEGYVLLSEDEAEKLRLLL